MSDEQSYADLTAMFEAQDDAFQADGFVEQTMQPIRRRARWRGPLLFGAGGLGVGAAVSQIGSLAGVVSEWMPERVVAALQTSEMSAQLAGPSSSLWLAAAGIMAICCCAIVISERA